MRLQRPHSRVWGLSPQGPGSSSRVAYVGAAGRGWVDSCRLAEGGVSDQCFSMLLRSAMQYFGDGFELAGHARSSRAKVLLDRNDQTLTLCGILVPRDNRTTLKGKTKSGENGNPATQFWRVNCEPPISGSKLGPARNHVHGLACHTPPPRPKEKNQKKNKVKELQYWIARYRSHYSIW